MALLESNEPKYLEVHKQIAFSLHESGVIQIYSYDLASYKYVLKHTLKTKCYPEYYPNGFTLNCRESKTFDIFTFTKKGDYRKVNTIKNVRSSRILEIGDQVFLLKIGNPFELINPVTGKIILNFKSRPHPIIGTNFLLLNKNEIAALENNKLVLKEKLPQEFQKVKLIDKSKNLFAFTSSRNAQVVIATLPFKIIQTIPEKTVDVLSPSVLLLSKAASDKISIYILKGKKWEKKQTLSRLTPVSFEQGLIRVWDESFLKWNPLTETLDAVSEVKFGRESHLLSAHLILQDLEHPFITNIFTGKKLQTFALENYEEGEAVLLSPNPQEYLQLAEIVQAEIPCKNFSCVLPKALIQYAVNFL
jgi:hypothetical protein